ncbi:MCE family protein [Aldersonia sp. NBC_00410]|uniref:MCE family protein n=1 Tax=Aldersonia sp. NBC_00410 TaxID=2975954 RepID=UPI00225011F0|nr:MCE family protein [Aldersonia sp. NBC_00410]MCX5041658.1 MCE family protein [Aldersonia sp. NBC_00410]
MEQSRRSATSIGAIGVFMVLLVTLSMFFLDSLPILGAGTKYTAEFTEAAGLREGDEVRIAGVKVGTVSGIKLDGDRVLVDFRTRNAWVGNQTTAAIEIKTVLGLKYLSLDPGGDDHARPGSTIPLSRTTSPYDVIDAFSAAASTIGDIDTDQLANSMVVLSDAFADTPPDIRSSIDGVTRLSETLAKRDQELKKLFAATKQTTQVLADRNAEFEQLLARGGELLAELNTRQQSISILLDSTRRLSTELSAFVHDNEEQIRPTLANLRAVVDILDQNLQNVNETLDRAAPFYSIYADVLGNGRWFDAVVVNLTPPGLPDKIITDRPPFRQLGGN